MGMSAYPKELLLNKDVRRLIAEALTQLIHSGHELGGMGEYGRGWNDSRIQMRIMGKEMIERWLNGE